MKKAQTELVNLLLLSPGGFSYLTKYLNREMFYLKQVWQIMNFREKLYAHNIQI